MRGILALALLNCLMLGVGCANSATPSPGGAYLAELRKRVEDSRTELPVITRSAEEAARRVVAGGKIWAGGSQGDFAHEAVERASGLMGLGLVTPAGKLSNHDVVLVGARGPLSDDDVANIKRWRASGAYVIAFARGPVNVADSTIDCGPNALAIPTDTTVNLVHLWSWIGEFTSACTRLGKTPTFYISYWLPGGRQWAGKYRNQMFHTDLNVAPVPPASLGIQYLNEIDKVLRDIEHELPEIRQASQWIRQTPRDKIDLAVMAHLYPENFEDPREPRVFPTINHWEKDVPKTAPLIVLLGYQFAPDNLIAHLTGSQRLIYTTVQRTTRPSAKNILYINPHWPLEDGCCQIPGYPHPILPASAIAQSAIYRAMLAEVTAIQRTSG